VSGALQTFVAGLVAIGIVTAVLLPGRQTPAVIKAGGNALSSSLSTAISGK
jgi:hypothetical protein